MVDSAVLNGLGWPLPGHESLALDLVGMWSEPHRRYHDVRHLGECLAASVMLGGGTTESLALWFHDAVHTGTPGRDEAAAAALAHERLAPLLSADRVAEVVRLVLVTERHAVAAHDQAGAVVSDADLWVLGAEPARYAESVADLRDETGLADRAWTAVRRRQLEARLARPVYATAHGRHREAAARHNLRAELAGLSPRR
jgi:predicted metal-dependent HD superfamily phosphohydrolase